MPTDIKRLHESWALRERVGVGNMPRNSGKTFLRVHELAAAICLRQCNYFVVQITNNNDIYYLGPMISDVFQEYGITILPGRPFPISRELSVRYALTDSKIVFVSERVNVLQATRGMAFAPNEHGFIPMGHWD